MKETSKGNEWDLKKMKEKIEEIEQSLMDLNQLGKAIPAVEKNIRSMLNSIYVLKFGISDIAEMKDH